MRAKANVERSDIGTICLVQETDDGRIRQIGLTEDQSRILQLFLASLSKEKPLVIMGEDYDLVLKYPLNNSKTIKK